MIDLRPRSLSQRLFAVTAVALLPAVVIVVTSVLTLGKDSQDALHMQALQTAELESNQLERIISGAEDVLRAVTVTQVIETGGFDACSAVVRKMADALPFLSAIEVINADGSARCLSDTNQPARFFGDESYFQEALLTNDRVTGLFDPNGPEGRPQLPVALRIGGEGGTPPGVAVAFIDLDWLQKSVNERTFLPGSSVTISDRAGTIIARVPDPAKFVGTAIPDTFQYLLKETKPGTLELTSQDGTRRVLGYFPVSAAPAGLYVSAGYSTALGYKPFRAISLQALLITVGGILVAFLLANRTAKVFIAKPVQTLIETITAWRNGDLSARTGLKAKDGEICGAGQAFDEFIEELVANREARLRSEEQKELLSEELEHRIKNLLATVQAIARQTFANSDNGEALAIFLQRLQAIGDSIRLLRGENWQGAPLRALIESSVAPFTGMTSHRVLITGPDFVVGSKVAFGLNMALHELCTNSMKYGALSTETGVVSIHWGITPSPAGDQFHLTWKEENGPPVVRPERTGFGSKVIKLVLASACEGDVAISYNPEGVVCHVSAAAAKVRVGTAAPEENAGLTGGMPRS